MGEEQNQSLNLTFKGVVNDACVEKMVKKVSGNFVIFCVEVTLGNMIVKYLKGRTVNTIGNPENIEYKSKYKFKY